MIEVCNVDFLNSKDPKRVLKEAIELVFRITSTQENQRMRVKAIYIGTPAKDDYDQLLCDEVVENIPKGVVEFDLECAAPDLEKIPQKYLLDLKSLVIICYTEEEEEFTRIGYFVKVRYPGVQIKETDLAEEAEEEEDDAAEEACEESDEEGDEEVSRELDSEEVDEELDESEEEDSGLGTDEEEEPVESGIQLLTPDEFDAMEIDLQHIEAEIVEPPLVTVFSNVWPKQAQDAGEAPDREL